MGMGTSQNINQVYYDANNGQYFTVNPYGPFSQMKTYLNTNPFATNTTQSNSMVNAGIDRAKAAYQSALSGINTNPAYNASAMFPGLTLSNNTGTSAPMGMYGAGRFLSPASAQSTGGVLGLNFSTPGTTTK